MLLPVLMFIHRDKGTPPALLLRQIPMTYLILVVIPLECPSGHGVGGNRATAMSANAGMIRSEASITSRLHPGEGDTPRAGNPKISTNEQETPTDA